MRFTLLMVAALLLAAVAVAPAPVRGCVGKVLHIGVGAAPEEQLLGELIAQLVMERTGTTVKVSPFKDSRQLYEAVRKGDVGLIIESPAAAMALLGKPRDPNRRSELELVRKEYRKSYNMIWLEPIPGNDAITPVLTTDTLSHLPALPKLINKLPTVLAEDALQKLARSLRGDEKPRKVARDYLKAKKLI